VIINIHNILETFKHDQNVCNDLIFIFFTLKIISIKLAIISSSKILSIFTKTKSTLVLVFKGEFFFATHFGT